MISMGIDASTTSTGWSIFNGDKLIASGTIKPKGNEWRERVINEWDYYCKIVEKYSPEIIYMEDVPLKSGNQTLLKLGAVQGVILALSAQYHIKVEYLLPSDWRRPLDLYDGTREGTHREVLKKKAIEMVNKVFDKSLLWVAPKSKRNEDDEAEAILVAYSQVKSKTRFGRAKA